MSLFCYSLVSFLKKERCNVMMSRNRLYHVTCVSQSCAFKSMCSERLTSLVSVEAVMSSRIKKVYDSNFLVSGYYK